MFRTFVGAKVVNILLTVFLHIAHCSLLIDRRPGMICPCESAIAKNLLFKVNPETRTLVLKPGKIFTPTCWNI
jgi:hypothetical protein